MEIKACRTCRRLFHDFRGIDICPECEKNSAVPSQKLVDNKLIYKERLITKLKTNGDENDVRYEEIKEYIEAHPRDTIMQISIAKKINPSTLIKWVREDKLEFSDDSKSAWFECEQCGTKIRSGRLCFKCK